MHRQPLLSLLQNYTPLNEEERGMWTRTLSFVQQQPNCFARSLAEGHVTGSAWIVAARAGGELPDRVVLIHHRKLDRWFQPGGHADGNPAVWEVARQEAEEETGLTQLRFVGTDGGIPPIYDIDVHLIPARKDEPAHWHYDIRFLLEASPEEPFRMSKETKAVKWVSLAEVPLFTQETSIQRMLQKMAQSPSGD